ncbi:MAG: hypothetical protein KF726_11125 [Anaerolineae bacterium]|nr:hypothetical protein [Anaerolineae bacterium]
MSMLAVVNADGNIALYDANGQNPRALTSDAAPGLRVYQWPTWSTDGRLAFFGASAEPANSYSLGVFIARDPLTGVYTTAYTSPDEVYTYAYWSTGDCAAGDCRVLALLFTPESGSSLALRMIRDNQGVLTNLIAGRAAPFYYSFSPDGKQMLWFRMNSRLELFNVDENSISDTLQDIPGQFASPMWSPVDDRILFGVQSTDPAQTDLVIAQGSNRRAIVSGIEGSLAFAWSPDASKISYAATGGKLTVIDMSGKVIATAKESNVIAHFWSPLGDKIAFITLNREQPGLNARYHPNGRTAAAGTQTPTLTWFVLDLTSNTTTALVDFFPTRDMIYYLNFADQFSRSHSLWSPDGRYLVYGSASNGTDQVLLVEAITGAVTNVAEGTLGVWSWK